MKAVCVEMPVCRLHFVDGHWNSLHSHFPSCWTIACCSALHGKLQAWTPQQTAVLLVSENTLVTFVIWAIACIPSMGSTVSICTEAWLFVVIYMLGVSICAAVASLLHHGAYSWLRISAMVYRLSLGRTKTTSFAFRSCCCCCSERSAEKRAILLSTLSGYRLSFFYCQEASCSCKPDNQVVLGMVRWILLRMFVKWDIACAP